MSNSNQDKKVVIKIKYVGVDFWSRPIFKAIDKSYYFGSVDVLLPHPMVSPSNDDKEISDFFKENIFHLDYFGTSFGCEPQGGLNPNVELQIID